MYWSHCHLIFVKHCIWNLTDVKYVAIKSYKCSCWWSKNRSAKVSNVKSGHKPSGCWQLGLYQRGMTCAAKEGETAVSITLNRRWRECHRLQQHEDQVLPVSKIVCRPRCNIEPLVSVLCGTHLPRSVKHQSSQAAPPHRAKGWFIQVQSTAMRSSSISGSQHCVMLPVLLRK